MADARAEWDWCHTAAVLSMVWNVNVDPKHRKPPDHFNPLKIAKRRRKKFDIEALKMCIPAYKEAQLAKEAAEASAGKPCGLVGGGSTPADPKHFIQ